MFTLEQIKSAHSMVKSGADFPDYIQAIKALGVTKYDAYVADGRMVYFGNADYRLEALGRYEPMVIAESTYQVEFRKQLEEHQQGRTDFPTFIRMCATTGIEKWTIVMDAMTCTYFDKAGKEILVEKIPTR